MARIVDPEGREPDALDRLVIFRDREVLDIGCVGDVLRKVHGRLRPRGLLVNMQLHGRLLDLEVRRGAVRRSAGTAFDNSECREDMRASLRELAELTAAGMFKLRQEIRLDFEFHFQTVEDWTEWIVRPRAGGLEANQELLDKTLPALASGEATIVATEKDVAGVYERIP